MKKENLIRIVEAASVILMEILREIFNKSSGKGKKKK